MLCKAPISSEHCPQTLSITSHSSLPIPTAQQGNQGPEGQLHVTGGLWSTELPDCYPFCGRAKNNSAFHWDITVRSEHARLSASYLTGSVFQTGDCKHSAGLVFSTSSPFCRGWQWLWEVCVHTAQSAASTPGQAQPEKQSQHRARLAGRLSSCHATTERPGLMAIQRSWSQFQLSQITSESTEELNKDQKTSPLQEAGRNQNMAQVLIERNSSPQPSSFTPSPWAV